MAEMVYLLSLLWLGKSEIICYNYTEKINSKGEFQMNIWFVGELLLRLECESLERFEQAERLQV